MQSLNSPTIPACPHPRPGSRPVPPPAAFPRLCPPCEEAALSAQPASEALLQRSAAPGAARDQPEREWRASPSAWEPVAPRRLRVQLVVASLTLVAAMVATASTRPVAALSRQDVNLDPPTAAVPTVTPSAGHVIEGRWSGCTLDSADVDLISVRCAPDARFTLELLEAEATDPDHTVCRFLANGDGTGALVCSDGSDRLVRGPAFASPTLSRPTCSVRADATDAVTLQCPEGIRVGRLVS